MTLIKPVGHLTETNSKPGLDDANQANDLTHSDTNEEDRNISIGSPEDPTTTARRLANATQGSHIARQNLPDDVVIQPQSTTPITAPGNETLVQELKEQAKEVDYTRNSW